MKKNRILLMRNGERITITDEQGKWWVTEQGKFRKLNAQIDRVLDESKDSSESLVEEIAEVKNVVAEPKRKTSRKNKTEDQKEAKGD